MEKVNWTVVLTLLGMAVIFVVALGLMFAGQMVFTAAAAGEVWAIVVVVVLATVVVVGAGAAIANLSVLSNSIENKSFATQLMLMMNANAQENADIQRITATAAQAQLRALREAERLEAQRPVLVQQELLTAPEPVETTTIAPNIFG